MVLAPFIVLVPPILGIVLSYRISIMYSRSLPTEKTRKGRIVLNALLSVFSLLAIQGLLGLFGIYFGGIS